MSGTTSAALLNARYVAIRTAEAKGLTGRLLEAARDRTPGVRKLLLPILYRFWHRQREDGWMLLQRIADDVVRFPGMVNREALQILVSISVPILNACRHDPAQLARLGQIWQRLMAHLFGSPLARTAGVLGRNWVLRAVSRSFTEMMKRQPIYQPLNYHELETTFARDAAFRTQWREVLACLEQPDATPLAVERILGKTDLPFDLYLMLCCERSLIQYGVLCDAGAAMDMGERLFHGGASWFRQSVLYALFHVLNTLSAVEDGWLERYDALAETFFLSGSWKLRTAAGRYEMPGYIGNADVLGAKHRGRAPRIVPAMMRAALASGAEDQVAAVFAAIDGVTFYHNSGALALAMIERCQELGGAGVGRYVTASLASVRLLDQQLLDAFLEQNRLFGAIDAAHVAATEPSITEEDLPTLIDGFVIQSLLTSRASHAHVCTVFRRALDARSPQEVMVQLMMWVRDELAVWSRKVAS